MFTQPTVELNFSGLSTTLEGTFATAFKILIALAVLYALFKFLEKDKVSITIA